MIDVEKTLEKINASVKKELHEWETTNYAPPKQGDIFALTTMLCQKEIVSLLVNILAEIQKGNKNENHQDDSD